MHSLYPRASVTSRQKERGGDSQIDAGERWKTSINNERETLEEEDSRHESKRRTQRVSGRAKEAPKAAQWKREQQMCFKLVWPEECSPWKRSEMATPRPCNPIPRGTSISLLWSLPLSTPTPPTPPSLITMSLLGASDHSNQTRIASGSVKASSAPQRSALCSSSPFISLGLAFG